MPSSLLNIAPGVVLEFYPSVGILALGPLIAQGEPDAPIIMRPITVHKRVRKFLVYTRISKDIVYKFVISLGANRVTA